MSIVRPFQATDILHFNKVNVDPWTATYHSGYYSSYLAQWPDFCVTAVSASDGGIKAYMLGKHEPPPPDPQHHVHLTAMSVAPEYRGMGIAKIFMSLLERLAGPQDPSDLSNYSDPSISESSGINPLTGLPNIPNSQNSLTPGSKSTQKSYDQSQPQSQSQDPIGTANPIESSFSPPKESSYVMRDAVNAWFVDLFVRCNNVRAVEMYERLGYSVFRRVQNYYQSIEEVSSPDELDGFDMRKSMPRDTTSRYVRSNGRDILVGPDQVWA